MWWLNDSDPETSSHQESPSQENIEQVSEDVPAASTTACGGGEGDQAGGRMGLQERLRPPSRPARLAAVLMDGRRAGGLSFESRR